MSQETTGKNKEKALVVKLDPASRAVAKNVLDQANAGGQFKKTVSFKDMFDHLLKKYGERAIPELMKMREQPEDKSHLRYQKSGSDLEYAAWVEEELSVLDELRRKSSKKKKQGEKSVG